MKKLTKAVLAILVVASSITACKKGEDDPGLSLSSRKSRLAGEWKVATYDEAITDVTTNNGLTNVTTRTEVNTTKIAGSVITITSNVTSTQQSFSSYTETETGTLSEYNYTIEKDGTWTSKKVTKMTSKSSTNTISGAPATISLNITTTIESSGTWQFLGKNSGAELKNKEAVLLSTAKMTTTTVDVTTDGTNKTVTTIDNQTFALNENTQVWTLSQLAKKEMAANIAVDNKNDDSETTVGGGSTSITVKNGPDSSKGIISITFTQD
jgi:hypothetical protein